MNCHSNAGRKGGNVTFKRYGCEHMQAIGRKGAQTFWRLYKLEPCDLADFAIVERETGRVVNLLNGTRKLLNYRKQREQ